MKNKSMVVLMSESGAGFGRIAGNVGDKLRRYGRADVALYHVYDVSVEIGHADKR